jgi:hypothetical protein
MKRALILLLLLFVVPAAPAAAQTALINGLNDLSSTWNGTSTQIQLEDVHCVAVSNGGEYQVTITGSGTSNAFTLASGIKTLAYTVEYKDNNLAYRSVTTNVPLTGFDSGDTTPSACSGTNAQAFVRVTFTEAVLAAATAGTYTGTLTIRVTPI